MNRMKEEAAAEQAPNIRTLKKTRPGVGKVVSQRVLDANGMADSS